MRMLKLILFVCILWLGSVWPSMACNPGWFGSSCEFKCHCEKSMCKDDGTCMDGAKCNKGWFGPACQYVDLASKITTAAADTLTDGDDDTCNNNTALESVDVILKRRYPFTWMRLVVKDPAEDFLQRVVVRFKTTDSSDVVKCDNPRQSVINLWTFDIKCDESTAVKEVILTGRGVKLLCSVYISGGRNVALPQNHPAVDGDSSTCSSTSRLFAAKYLWKLSLSQPALVNRYVLKTNANGFASQPSKIVVEGYDTGKAPVMRRETDTDHAQFAYTALDVPAGKRVSSVEVSLTAIDPNAETRFTLCETEVYSECSPTVYGFNCTQPCSTNCTDKMCHHANGHCYDCMPGKSGEFCQTDCPAGYYGQRCSTMCNPNCRMGECDSQDGTCSNGCRRGFTDSKCDKECASKWYGVNWTRTCSINCENEMCHHISGHCDMCVLGKSGDFCTEDCKQGSYGHGCNETCNINCNGACDVRNGTCLQGCKPGYLGMHCDKKCPPKFFGKDCLQNCSINCLVNETLHPEVCQHDTGRCLTGCLMGFTGDDCSIEKPSAFTSPGGDETPPAITLIAGGVGAAVAVVLVAFLAVIGVLLWRRRQKSKMEGQTDLTERNIDYEKSKPDAFELVPAANGANEPAVSKTGDSGTYYNMTPQAVHVLTAIPVSMLNAFMSSHDEKYFKDQFAQIPERNAEATTEVSLKQENRKKNRYKNIYPYDDSRVRLSIREERKEGDYINASYVEGYNNEEKFIASQAPTKVMINDFVRMLWEEKAEKVVMLTNLIEEGKSKCERYWPEDDVIEFDGIQVKLATTQVFADYTIRKLKLEKDQESHFLTHFHFTSWPDMGVPATPWALVDFEQRVASFPTSRPTVVHCSAGVGRTGTFIALQNLIREAVDTGHMEFYSTLVKLRKDRMNMVQTAEQYIFLHKAAQVAVVCMDTTVTSKDITERMKFLEASAPSGMTNIAKEFEAVCTVCTECVGVTQESELECDVGNTYVNSRNVTNKSKNRFSNVLPKDEYRPHLTQNIRDTGDYINAVFVPSFSKLNNQILTQLPLPTTVLDFWRLVTQFDISLVVAFELDSALQDSTMGVYMPAGVDEQFSCKPFNVTAGPPIAGSHWEERKLFTTRENRKSALSKLRSQSTAEHRVTHLKISSSQLDPDTLLSVVNQIRSYRSSNHGRTVYMCRNGATYSGLVCVLSLLLDRMDNDQRLTVPLVVGTIKSIRPQVIPTLEQYKTLYEVLKQYSETSVVYCNFDMKPAAIQLPD